MARDAASAALLFAATLLGGCDSEEPYSFTSGTVAVTSIEVIPTEGGGAEIDAVLSLELQAYEEPDEVALDSLSFAIVAGASVLDEGDVVLDDVVFDDDEWPAEVAPGTTVVRELRVAAHVDQLPEGTTGLCPIPLLVEATVGLLVVAGASKLVVAGSIEMTGSAEITLDAGGPRLGLARRGGEVPATFDAYSTSVDATVDGEGTTWMLVHEVNGAASHLVSRRSTGEVAQQDLISPAATMAPVAEGGLVVVEVVPGKAVISRLRGTGETLWARELRSTALTIDRGVPMTVGAHGVTLALPGRAEVSMDGLPDAPPTSGSFLVDVDLDGTPASITSVPIGGQDEFGVHALASAGELLVLATPGELVALRGRQVAWRVPSLATALTITSDDDILAAGQGLVVRLRGESGVQVWSAPLTYAASATSIAMRANGEALVATAYGSVARIGPDGVVLFDGEVVCGGAVAFGGSGGRVGYGSAFQGVEGWGDTPDREVISPTLALGEVLP